MRFSRGSAAAEEVWVAVVAATVVAVGEEAAAQVMTLLAQAYLEATAEATAAVAAQGIKLESAHHLIVHLPVAQAGTLSRMALTAALVMGS